MEFFFMFFFLVLSYLIGSIPWGFLIGKLKGIDIREHGSKNIGATNTGRVLGKRYAFLTFFLDAFKGAFFVALYRFKVLPEEWCFISPLIYGMVAVIGHSYPIYLNFSGGKSVSTAGGAILGYCPVLLPIAVLIFFIVTLISKYVSLGSLVATFSVFVFSIILCVIGHDFIFTSLDVDILFPIFCLIALVLIFFRHRGNIVRLIQHTESKINWFSKKTKK